VSPKATRAHAPHAPTATHSVSRNLLWDPDRATYVRFASRQPALLELMFASLHRPGADRSLREANDRAFAAPIALIASARANGEIVADDPDRVEMAVLATLQGLAWLANSSVIGDRPIDTVVAETVETLSYGLKPTAS
jgi:hypothetical protein